MKKIVRNKAKWNGESSRAFNRSNVMKHVLENSGIDRTRLAEMTRLTNAAISGIVQELIDAGLLKDVGQVKSDGGRGRRRSGLEINEKGGYVVGISILAFNSSISLTNIAGELIDELHIQPTDISNVQQTLDEIADVTFSMIAKHNLDKKRVFGAGVAVAGYLDSSGEVLISSPYLGWPKFNLQQSLFERLDMNITVENVNRCIAIAESRIGCSVGTRDLVLIRAALGIGGAIINGNEILRGHENQAGQLGHIPIAAGGLLCTCGARGCLNTVASGWAILNQLGISNELKTGLAELESQENKLKKVLIQATEGDEKSQQAVRLSGQLLAENSIALLFALAPEALVVTGPLGRNEVYCNAFKETLKLNKINVKVLTAFNHEITAPAPAASVLALETQVFAPTFDIQYLLAESDMEGDVIEEKVLVL